MIIEVTHPPGSLPGTMSRANAPMTRPKIRKRIRCMARSFALSAPRPAGAGGALLRGVVAGGLHVADGAHGLDLGALAAHGGAGGLLALLDLLADVQLLADHGALLDGDVLLADGD